MIAGKQQHITTADNVSLSITIFEPEQSNQRVVLINSAMGVQQQFYQKFAAFLAEVGFLAITYDYRGVGASRPASLRGYDAHLWQWGAEDLTAVIHWVEVQHPNKPIVVVGHSVGGQIIGLTKKHAALRGLYGIAAQSAYWGWWPNPAKWRIYAVWHIVPIACTLAGYLPKQLLGGTEDIPAGVAREWAAGGRSPHYIVDVFRHSEHNHFGAVNMPMRLHSFADDTYAPRAAVEALAPLYPSAQVETKHIAPADMGVPKIGHFGFFRSAFKDTLWMESAKWLAEV